MIGSVKYPNIAIRNEQAYQTAGQDIQPQAAPAAGTAPPSGNNTGLDQYISGKNQKAAPSSRLGVQNSNQSGDTQSSLKCQT